MSRVLVVENHNGLRNIILKLLEGMGIETAEAHSVNEIYMHDIDLVIADDSSSKDLSDINVPVIVITPIAKNNNNNTHYIRQPFEVGELCNIVREKLCLSLEKY